MITHELKNRVGATLGAGQLLQEEWLGEEERRRFAGMVTDNAQEIQKVLENLVALVEARRRASSPAQHPPAGGGGEVFRQLRELARAREVELRVRGRAARRRGECSRGGALPVELPVQRHQVLGPRPAERWARVEAELPPVRPPGVVELVLCVTDNGLGVPEEHRGRACSSGSTAPMRN
jgi:signal transduction histidine kinase